MGLAGCLEPREPCRTIGGKVTLIYKPDALQLKIQIEALEGERDAVVRAHERLRLSLDSRLEILREELRKKMEMSHGG